MCLKTCMYMLFSRLLHALENLIIYSLYGLILQFVVRGLARSVSKGQGKPLGGKKHSNAHSSKKLCMMMTIQG